MTIHYWDDDEYIDSRIHDRFETPGWIYVIGNKFVNDRISGQTAATIVRFYLAARKKYPLRVWVPKGN